MLYKLYQYATHDFTFLNVFRYITFRTGGAIFTALFISFLFGPRFIKFLSFHQKKGQPIRDDGPESHIIGKRGTPTMGGVLILLALVLSTILWADLRNSYIWIAIFVTIGYGAIGAIDDYLKLKYHSSRGISGKTKFFLQVALALFAIQWVLTLSPEHHKFMLAFPFLKSAFWNMGLFFIPFALCVVVGSSNAVNLTDGLDGLATVPIILVAFCFGAIAYLVGNAIFANYLQLVHIPGAGELAVFCGALIGACLGFLWFNAPPAMVFMGDTGSLALGGALGILSVIIKHEIVLAITGGVFVMEALSVMMQVAYFKLTKGKRIFLMAPIHHHFEKKGWKESTIVIRFWIISFILSLVGLSTLKLR